MKQLKKVFGMRGKFLTLERLLGWRCAERRFLHSCMLRLGARCELWWCIIQRWMIQFCTYGYVPGMFRCKQRPHLLPSYVSAFGVYQDYYSRSFLSQDTPSDIRWGRPSKLIWSDFLIVLYSWIGSTQLFLQYAAGIFVGRAFDAGYLWVYYSWQCLKCDTHIDPRCRVTATTWSR